MTTTDPQKVITGKAIISYPNLFRPRAVKPGDEPKYSCSLIFDVATERKSLEELRAAAIYAGRDKFKNFDELLREAKLRMPWRRGEDRPDAKGYGPGKIYINCSSTEPPGVVDRQVKPILNASDIYPGCWVIASVRAFAYDMRGNKGVSFGLNHIQKIADGEPLGGRARPEQDFVPIGEDPAFGAGGSTDDMFK